MAWPAVGIVGGGEASAASQSATGGRSTRHDRCCFGRLEQEDQRLKKHYSRWMDFVRSLESTRAVDNGVSYEGNDTEPGKTRQWLPMRWRVRGLIGSAAVAGK